MKKSRDFMLMEVKKSSCKTLSILTREDMLLKMDNESFNDFCLMVRDSLKFYKRKRLINSKKGGK